jgi:hypothetical protein
VRLAFNLKKALEGANELFLIFYAALFMLLPPRDANLALSLSLAKVKRRHAA